METSIEGKRYTSLLKRLSLPNREAILGLIMAAPLIIWLAVTILYPLFSAVQLSFLDVRIVGTSGKFVGFDNYKFILSSTRFWDAFGRTLIWLVANAVIQTLLALTAAIILKQRFKGQSIARIWIIVSWIVPTVVVVIIWRWILGTSGGIVNYALMYIGLVSTPVGFFGSGTLAFATTILINSWRWFPLTAILLLAGMQDIPEEYYDAAAVDGASSWQKFIYITIPGLKPILFVLGLIGILWSVNVFDIIYLFTGGGPAEATTTLPVFIYETAFNSYRLSRAAAASVILGIFLLIYVLLFIKFMSSEDEG
jgi:multiple sugar transport system permease protein